MDVKTANWDDIVTAIAAKEGRLAPLLSGCRLELLPSGVFAVIAPNRPTFAAIEPHAKIIGDAVRDAFEIDDTINLTFERSPTGGQSILANPPNADDQMALFIPEVSELALKDDVHLMSIAPWTSSPAIDRDPDKMRTEINYEANGMAIQIQGTPKHGLPTHIDYDIVILMQSWLAQQANEFRDKRKQHEALRRKGYDSDPPSPPPRKFSVHKRDILAFARRGDGGKQYQKIEETLNRLANTKIMITQTGPRKRRKGLFSLISDWTTVSKTESGEIMSVKIEIPGWIYEGIVEAERPSVLTYSRDYFLLKKPNARLLYRLGKLHAKMGEVVFDLSEVHHRSGSRAALKEFNREFVQMLQSSDMTQFPDYHVELSDEKRNRKLKISAKAKGD